MNSSKGSRAEVYCVSEGGTISTQEWIDIPYTENYSQIEGIARDQIGSDLDDSEKRFLLLDAYTQAQQMLAANSECAEIFGTAETRANGWAPGTVLANLFFNQGSMGSIGYGPTLIPGAEALTSPTITRSGIGARININLNAWLSPENKLAGNARQRGLTLLHELGHAFNLLSLRGSGGSTIKQFDIWPANQLHNETEVWTKCWVVRMIPRP